MENNQFDSIYSIVSRMQKSLDTYKIKPKASEQAINTQQEIIDKLLFEIEQIKESYTHLIDHSESQYKRGFYKGVEFEKRKQRPNKYSINKETLRYNSIENAKQTWHNLY